MPRRKSSPVLDLRSTPVAAATAPLPMAKTLSKSKLAAAPPPPEPIAEPEPNVWVDPNTGEEYEEYEENAWQRTPLWLRVSGAVITLAILLAGSFELVYATKVFPGVTADGVYLGGLSQADATKRLAEKTRTFGGQVVTI